MDLTKKKNRKKLGKKALKFILKYGEKVLVKHGEKIVSALLSGAVGGVAMAKAEDGMKEPKKAKKDQKAGKKHRAADDEDDE